MPLSVCAPAPPGTSAPVDGSRGICPLTKMNPPAAIACEYGPIAAGPRSVEILCFRDIDPSLSPGLPALVPARRMLTACQLPLDVMDAFDGAKLVDDPLEV